MATKPPPFCIAPWVHAYRGPDGFRALCCLTTSMKAEHDHLADWWNSATLREARRTFLAGEVPAVCDHCMRSNRISGEGYNRDFAKKFGSALADIVAQTAADGSTSLLPRSIDYRTSYCNLRCRTCDARNSSSIYAEQARAGRFLPPRAASALEESQIEPEALSEVEYIYWAGGEPFLSPAHAPAMSALMESGRSSQVHVQYTTNLMHWTDEISSAMRRYGEAFASIAVGASVDALGEVGAYIRPGWLEDRFFSNLLSLRSWVPTAEVYLDVTLTNLGMLHLPALLERCAGERLSVTFKLMEPNAQNDFLDVQLLQREVVTDLLQRCFGLGLGEYYQRRVAEVAELLDRRYQGRPFAERDRQNLEVYEKLRGQPGLFRRQTAGKLILAGAEA